MGNPRCLIASKGKAKSILLYVFKKSNFNLGRTTPLPLISSLVDVYLSICCHFASGCE